MDSDGDLVHPSVVTWLGEGGGYQGSFVPALGMSRRYDSNTHIFWVLEAALETLAVNLEVLCKLLCLGFRSNIPTHHISLLVQYTKVRETI